MSSLRYDKRTGSKYPIEKPKMKAKAQPVVDPLHRDPATSLDDLHDLLRGTRGRLTREMLENLVRDGLLLRDVLKVSRGGGLLGSDRAKKFKALLGTCAGISTDELGYLISYARGMREGLPSKSTEEKKTTPTTDSWGSSTIAADSDPW